MTKPLPALLFAIALAGCSRSEPDAPPETNAAATPPVRPVASPTPVARPEPTPEAGPVANASITLPPPPPIDTDEQMRDDASATGMTARVQRDEEQTDEPAPANSDAP